LLRFEFVALRDDKDPRKVVWETLMFNRLAGYLPVLSSGGIKHLRSVIAPVADGRVGGLHNHLVRVIGMEKVERKARVPLAPHSFAQLSAPPLQLNTPQAPEPAYDCFLHA
jgi:hypothetical protein